MSQKYHPYGIVFRPPTYAYYGRSGTVLSVGGSPEGGGGGGGGNFTAKAEGDGQKTGFPFINPLNPLLAPFHPLPTLSYLRNSIQKENEPPL
jgi:hypothetical protein